MTGGAGRPATYSRTNPALQTVNGLPGYALEVADGGLFITRLLQKLSQAQNARLADLFAETQQVVKQDSGGQQTPVAVGDSRLGETLNLATAVR